MSDAEKAKKGRILVWHDEFDKDELDTDKWGFSHEMTTPEANYDNSEKNCRIENGKLLMQANRTGDTEKPYTLCEAVSTKRTMNWKYGYLEMRANPPYRHGAWPSFWMISKTPFSKADWFSEVDIYEIFSSDDKVVANLHKWGFGDGRHSSLDGQEGSQWRSYTFEKAEELNNEYHIYGFEWDPRRMSWYIDGKKYIEFAITDEECRVPNSLISGTEAFHDPHYIILNNEIFTPNRRWKPAGSILTEEDEFPIEYRVDWIRLYQNPEKEEIKLKADIEKALVKLKSIIK